MGEQYTEEFKQYLVEEYAKECSYLYLSEKNGIAKFICYSL